jgi:predicted metalloprotease with PDZ domain
LVLVRSGLISRQRFYERLAGEIGRLQERPARLFQSAELAGLDAWLERYPGYLRPTRSISYYNKGALLGFLLDLKIRHDSHNLHSLDDLMRRLNEDFARRGRFFTDADLRQLVAELAPQDHGLDSFFRDYVSGASELDYDTYLGYAGLQLRTEAAKGASLGFRTIQTADGPHRVEVDSIEPGSSAAQAGLAKGDVLCRWDGQELTSLPEQLPGLRPGQKIRLDVRRRGKILNLKFELGALRETTYRVSEIPGATDDQLRVRDGWLEGKP